MKKTITAIFQNLPQPDYAPDFEARLFAFLRSRQERALRFRAALSLVVGALSIIALAGSVAYAGNAFLHSEFWTFFSLLFSDAAVVFGNSGDFFSTLLETIPVLPLILFLIPLFLLSLSASLALSVWEKAGGKYFHLSYR